MIKTIRFWIHNARITALPQSVLPALLAVCLAFHRPGFSWWLAVLAVSGVVLGHLGCNLLDDFFDYLKKESSYRNRLEHQGMRARISKCTYLSSGAATVKQLFAASSCFCIGALICGGVIWYYRGDTIVWIALATALLGFFYSGPPFRLCYRGLGELQVGLMFGPLLMAGVYYAACGSWETSQLLISVPVGLLVANILYTHSMMDVAPDKQVGKMTLAVLLGSNGAMLTASALILLLPFLSVVTGVAAQKLPEATLLVLLTLPMAVTLFRLMAAFTRDPQKRFNPRWWMGPIPHWERYGQVGIDWFMIRWCLARNLLTFYCLLLMVAGLISKG